MSKSVEYREYVISSTPWQLSGKNESRSKIEIFSTREGIVAAEPYTDETIHATAEAAETHGIQLGQEIIDGKAPRIVGKVGRDFQRLRTTRTSELFIRAGKGGGVIWTMRALLHR